ncbi:MAG: phosphatidate cytidylyltransferase [Luteolibacter sp.]
MSQVANRPPPGKSSVFFRRAFSTLLLWGVVTAVLLSQSTWAYLGLISLLATLASLEYARMMRLSEVPSFGRFGLLVAIGYSLILHSFYLRGIHPPPWLDMAALFSVLVGAFALQLRYPIRGLEAIQSVSLTVLGWVYIPFCFHFASRLLFFPPDGFETAGMVSSSGALLLLWLLAVTKFTDMGAYLTGSLIGRHKLIPHVSPAKTWEGLLGAFLFAELAACGLPLLFPALLELLGGMAHAAILGLILGLLAVVGDLAESILKRALAAKDSGGMLPGIGGALDLIDSICFTAPALYLYLHWIHST